MTRPPTPWHQRVALVAHGRAWARCQLFRMLRAVAHTDDGRRILAEALGDLTSWRPADDQALPGASSPYPDLGGAYSDRPKAVKPVFVTARFRSGSTLLWNLFRQIERCTAYYEPFNERRWFDARVRGTRVDPTHRHIADYAREYDGLDELGQYYDEAWIRRDLYMDEASWNPAMAAYVRVLIARAPGRPVLQFNRIDFRLAWLRSLFPEATIVHMYRHPRDQWCSSLTNWAACTPDCDLTTFQPHDGFYLLTWVEDLKYRYPFLDVPASTHPYRLFYYLWKLSYLHGVAHAAHSVAYESLTAHPTLELERLFRAIGLTGVDIGRLATLIEPAEPRWPAYADAAWFESHEAACERTLHDFFAATRFRRLQSPERRAHDARAGLELARS